MAAIPASAQTFASFSYDNVGNVVYTNATGNLSSPTPVNVQFHFNAAGFGPGLLQPAGGPAGLLLPVAATLTLTGHNTGPAVVGTPDSQPYVIDGFQIIEVGGMNPGANLLSGTASPAILTATDTGTTAGLTASLPPAGTAISFTSDFVTFPSAVSASDVFTFTEPSPNPVTIAGNGNFQGSGGSDLLLHPDGSFTFIPPSGVPEPGTVALFSSLVVCGSAFGLRRLRRNK